MGEALDGEGEVDGMPLKWALAMGSPSGKARQGCYTEEEGAPDRG